MRGRHKRSGGESLRFFFVRVNLSPFVWGLNLRFNGFLLFIGYFIELVIFAEIRRHFGRYSAVCVNLSRFQRHLRPPVGRFKACQRFGRAGRFRAFWRVSRPYLRLCFFLIILYILLYRVRALRACVACVRCVRACVHICAYACINMQIWCRRCRRCRRCRQEKTPLPCRRCRRGVLSCCRVNLTRL